MLRTAKTIVASLAIFGLGLGSASAQTTETPSRSFAEEASRLDAKSSDGEIRVSQLMGMKIQNSKGEMLGEIKDLVLDNRTGGVKYVAVTYGGFLGFDSKLFAVPFDAFKVKTKNAENGTLKSSDYVLVLDVTQEQLKGDKGFDSDHWPNTADENWVADMDRRYGIDRRAAASNRVRGDQ